MIDYAIEKLLAYALEKELIQPCEKLWALNTLLEVCLLYTSDAADRLPRPV